VIGLTKQLATVLGGFLTVCGLRNQRDANIGEMSAFT